MKKILLVIFSVYAISTAAQNKWQSVKAITSDTNWKPNLRYTRREVDSAFSVQCEGTTLKGIRCTRKVKEGKLCFQHKNQK